MASGWNLWVWLECIGVVIIIIIFPYSTCISSFLAAVSLFLCSFLKCFFLLVYIYIYICMLVLVHNHISLVPIYCILYTVYCIAPNFGGAQFLQNGIFKNFAETIFVELNLEVQCQSVESAKSMCLENLVLFGTLCY